MRFILLVYGFLFFLIGCSLNDKKKQLAAKRSEDLLIVLQPFDAFTKKEAESLSPLFKQNGWRVQVANPIPLPPAAYYKAKNRYRADSLLRFLQLGTKENTVTIGLTHKDISVTNGKIADWGIMGLGYQPGNACVVSSFRIRGKNKSQKMQKVLMHEFAHTRGLPHCAVNDCLMRDAKGKDHLDEEKDFCKDCRGFLVKSGFSVKKVIL